MVAHRCLVPENNEQLVCTLIWICKTIASCFFAPSDRPVSNDPRSKSPKTTPAELYRDDMGDLLHLHEKTWHGLYNVHISRKPEKEKKALWTLNDWLKSMGQWVGVHAGGGMGPCWDLGLCPGGAGGQLLRLLSPPLSLHRHGLGSCCCVSSWLCLGRGVRWLVYVHWVSFWQLNLWHRGF